jgi:hypothetical protein
MLRSVFERSSIRHGCWREYSSWGAGMQVELTTHESGRGAWFRSRYLWQAHERTSTGANPGIATRVGASLGQPPTGRRPWIRTWPVELRLDVPLGQKTFSETCFMSVSLGNCLPFSRNAFLESSLKSSYEMLLFRCGDSGIRALAQLHDGDKSLFFSFFFWIWLVGWLVVLFGSMELELWHYGGHQHIESERETSTYWRAQSVICWQ